MFRIEFCSKLSLNQSRAGFILDILGATLSAAGPHSPEEGFFEWIRVLKAQRSWFMAKGFRFFKTIYVALSGPQGLHSHFLSTVKFPKMDIFIPTVRFQDSRIFCTSSFSWPRTLKEFETRGFFPKAVGFQLVSQFSSFFMVFHVAFSGPQGPH